MEVFFVFFALYEEMFSVFTALSASLLACGLCGDVSSCVMLCSLQNWSNSEWNCGPPSEHMVSGHPSRSNQCFSCLVTADMFV